MLDSVQINPWGCVAAGFAIFILGGLWFSPMLFSKTWAESLRASGREAGKPMVALPILLVTSIAATFVMAATFSLAGWDTTVRGLVGGLAVGAVVSMCSLADASFTGMLAARWWWIQWAFRFLSIVVAGIIVGASAPERITPENALEKASQTIEKSLESMDK
ncbi:MAG TPA: DUF1761 domain-containing protein [Fibrobacteria bacterium]|nr:DUF1761 domain-containing protein [Fibrobacteria bacterium]HOX51998.1 DUF1761 domain-containing protein [Fibrobacteria bacterium]